ncbi:4-(cytidine 5'-diphospho)-2-C-methyl-D-erythritol kinase [Methylocapsa acidiphila]|uniref:4-(cytidine 5'-diphospho)-2-C-methyl-D-erythritol kinase n=1 Tax=Methylocapsa acidiphila TaxID=133552 RepID=UPI00041918CA|nr:4-(cytidine 5'-diphospho)-2-C-methyl-D-erythritol kinase [Methylocapsa acidiphila]
MHLLTERAPAKINLTLHVLGRRADGWHDLESLVVFSRGGDCLSLAAGEPLSLVVDGPTASAAGALDDNLVLRAARNFSKHYAGAKLGAFHLVKRLPVAAGIGGGSSDAAAALRLLARANGMSLAEPGLAEAARETGADVPVCLGRQARMMRGAGEKLGNPVALPPLIGLIVNPGQPLETKSVFAKMNIAPGTESDFGAHPNFTSNMPIDALMAALRKGRNDMEAAACRLAPIIGDVLAVLSAAPGCRLARMSGSGATCFGLFKDCRSAARAKKAILRAHPGWWVKACVLN